MDKPKGRFRRFKLSSLLLLMTGLAGYCGYLVNRFDTGADMMILWQRDIGLDADFPDTAFLNRVCQREEASDLKSLARSADPAAWLGNRISVTNAEGSDVYRFQIEGNSYRDTVADFVPILNAVAMELMDTYNDGGRIAVVSTPALTH